MKILLLKVTGDVRLCVLRSQNRNRTSIIVEYKSCEQFHMLLTISDVTKITKKNVYKDLTLKSGNQEGNLHVLVYTF